MEEPTSRLRSRSLPAQERQQLQLLLPKTAAGCKQSKAFDPMASLGQREPAVSVEKESKKEPPLKKLKSDIRQKLGQ